MMYCGCSMCNCVHVEVLQWRFVVTATLVGHWNWYANDETVVLNWLWFVIKIFSSHHTSFNNWGESEREEIEWRCFRAPTICGSRIWPQCLTEDDKKCSLQGHPIICTQLSNTAGLSPMLTLCTNCQIAGLTHNTWNLCMWAFWYGTKILFFESVLLVILVANR